MTMTYATFADMLGYLKSIYLGTYSGELLRETVRLYREGVRDARLHDIGIMLIDKYGY